MFIGMSVKLIANGHLQINMCTEYGQRPNKSKFLNTVSKHNYNTCIHTQHNGYLGTVRV